MRASLFGRVPMPYLLMHVLFSLGLSKESTLSCPERRTGPTAREDVIRYDSVLVLLFLSLEKWSMVLCYTNQVLLRQESANFSSGNSSILKRIVFLGRERKRDRVVLGLESRPVRLWLY